jgi:tRNA A-37 threonylcarbamoyl transferase component Bud32
MSTGPLPILASGRDGDIFEFGPGLVLRRTKSGRVIEREARTMEYVKEHGYPCPAIHEVRAGGTEIVMERIEGPMMMDAMLRRPWLMGKYARMLADLHDRLHVIPAPEWLPELDGGDRLVHLDLHPMNVMMSPAGPIVIDWPNASRGYALTDVAVTMVLLTCPDMPGPRAAALAAKPARAFLAHAFAQRYKGRALNERIAWVAPLKTLDNNLSDTEKDACLRFGNRARARLDD